MRRREADAMTAWRILADIPKCAAKECNHHPRGTLTSFGKRDLDPGVYCRCCAVVSNMGVYDTDAFDCTGNQIDDSSVLTKTRYHGYILKGANK